MHQTEGQDHTVVVGSRGNAVDVTHRRVQAGVRVGHDGTRSDELRIDTSPTAGTLIVTRCVPGVQNSFTQTGITTRNRPRAATVVRTVGRMIPTFDAGTPGISDPGWYLVREARLQGAQVFPIPGACAAVAALSVVPFPTRRFHFEGFLPHSGKQRRVAVQRVAACNDTVVLYESPHRLSSTLEELAQSCPERELFVTREMTKKFEESWWGPAEAAPAVWAEKKTCFRKKKTENKQTIKNLIKQLSKNLKKTF